jgi:hypothetical protein
MQRLANVNVEIPNIEVPRVRYQSIYYIRGLSERIAHNIENEITDVRVAYRPSRTMDCIYSKMKDKNSKWDISSVIYAIQCMICPVKREYIGKTEQRLGSRNKQHLNIAQKMMKLMQQERDLNPDMDESVIFINESVDENLIKNQIMELCNISAIAQHMYESGHTFDFENTRILNHESNSRKLSILEMLYINQMPNVNKIVDLDKLSIAYKGILKTLNDKKK